MDNSELKDSTCLPCEGFGKPLTRNDAGGLLRQVPGWELSADGKSILRRLQMKNFLAAIHLFQRIAQIAEGENHHPDLHLTGYRTVTLELSTHSLGGLTENDFIVAAKINELPLDLKQD